jgi:hypothetical protein
MIMDGFVDLFYDYRYFLNLNDWKVKLQGFKKDVMFEPRLRWEDNIEMEVGCGGIDWIELAPERNRWRALVNAVMNVRVQ